MAINYKKETDLPKAIMDATEGKGVNIILDCVGAQWATMVQKFFKLITLIMPLEYTSGSSRCQVDLIRSSLRR